MILTERDIELLNVCKEVNHAKWLGQTPNWKEVGERLGRTNNGVGKQYRRIEKRVKKHGTSISDQLENYSNIISNVATIENIGDNPQTLIDSIYASSGIDRNRYEIKIKNLWGNPDKPQVSYDVIPKAIPDNYEEIFETLSKLDFKFDIPENNDVGDHMVLFSTYDLHLSKRGVDGTGHNETIEGYKRAVEELVAQLRSYSISRVVWVLGNDLIHSTILNQTTAGTPQDVSTGWKYAFDLACELSLWTVNILSQLGKVHIIPIEGNHSTSDDFALSRVVKHAFGDRITFDDSLNSRKYYKFDRVGLQFAHGHEEKKTSMLSLFITEEPEMFVNTDLHISYTGHLHGLKTSVTTISEEHGFIQRTLPSMNPRNDSWHNGKGYINNNAMGIAHLFKGNKQVAEFYAHV